MVRLTLITLAVYCTYGPFWSLPSLFMLGSAAVVGLASTNSIAKLGGFVGPCGFGVPPRAPHARSWKHISASPTVP